MRRELYQQMCHAAEELLRLAAGGIAVDPSTITWAEFIVKNWRSMLPPERPSFNQEQVLRVMQQHPVEGVLANWVFERTDLTKRECAVTLCNMVKAGKLAMLKIPGRSRFFLDQVALEQGRPLVEADERARIEARIKPKPVRQPVPQPVRPPRPAKRRPVEQRPEIKPAVPVVPVQSLRADLPVVVPAHVAVQVIPPKRDTRYSVPTPEAFEGEFMRDWKAKRQGGSSD